MNDDMIAAVTDMQSAYTAVQTANANMATSSATFAANKITSSTAAARFTYAQAALLALVVSSIRA